jgi:hypothetical protein
MKPLIISLCKRLVSLFHSNWKWWIEPFVRVYGFRQTHPWIHIVRGLTISWCFSWVFFIFFFYLVCVKFQVSSVSIVYDFCVFWISIVSLVFGFYVFLKYDVWLINYLVSYVLVASCYDVFLLLVVCLVFYLCLYFMFQISIFFKKL